MILVQELILNTNVTFYPQDWLATPGGAGNTCPLCREYIVAEDQFPGLGQGLRRRN